MQGTYHFRKPIAQLKKQAKTAEALAPNFLIQHNLPLTTAVCLRFPRQYAMGSLNHC